MAAGWRDLWTAPGVGLTFGLVFAVAAASIVWGLSQFGLQSLVLALAGGFLLIGPLMAVGLYATSQRIAEGKSVSLGDAVGAVAGIREQLAFMGVALLLAYLIWLLLALALFIVFMGQGGLPELDRFVHQLLFSPRGLALLVIGTATGAILATIVFAISAVSVPLLMDKPIDIVTAMTTSVRACLTNPKPMALWAALIAATMACGFATLFVGLVIAFPLVGHATWHAYKDLIGE
jgi:uncharacterized membrane protein